MTPRLYAVALVLAGLNLSHAAAEEITVCSSGCQYSSINDAIAVAENGDVIKLSAETYTEGSEINTQGKSITILGALSSGGQAASIIDGAGSHRIVSCKNQETSGTIFINLVIQNGSAYNGAGFDIEQNSSPTIANCTFNNNNATNSGGAIFCFTNSSPTIRDCTFTSNTAVNSGNSGGNGGALSLSNTCSPQVVNCTFTENTSWQGGGCMIANSCSPEFFSCRFDGNETTNWYGGAVSITNQSLPQFLDCIFEDNDGGPRGGAAFVFNGSDCTFRHCSFESNVAVKGGAIYCSLNAKPTIENCLMKTNTATGGSGGGVYNDNSVPSLGSNCLESNTESQIVGSYTDLNGNCIIQTAATQCGTCLSFQDATTTPSCPADLNGDGEVDGQDLAAVLAAWGLPCDG